MSKTAEKTSRHKSNARASREERRQLMDSEVLDAEAAGAVLGVSKWLVLRLARQKEIPGKKVGREWRFRRSALLKWLAGEGGVENGVDLQKLLNSGRAKIVTKK